MSMGRESKETTYFVSQYQVLSQNTNTANSSVEAVSVNSTNPQVIETSDTATSMESILRFPYVNYSYKVQSALEEGQESILSFLIKDVHLTVYLLPFT